MSKEARGQNSVPSGGDAESRATVGRARGYRKSVPSPQFCWEPNTALKNSLLKQ